MDTRIFTRETNRILTIWTVTYEAITNFIVVPSKELNIIEEDITRVKSKKIDYFHQTELVKQEYNHETMIHLGIWVNKDIV